MSQSEMERPWSGTVGMEGVTTSDGRHILAGALAFPKDRVALIDQDGQLVGYAENFERGEHGRIQASGVIRAEAKGAPTIFVTAIEYDKSRKDVMRITAAQIRAVLITNHPAWPECSFDS